MGHPSQSFSCRLCRKRVDWAGLPAPALDASDVLISRKSKKHPDLSRCPHCGLVQIPGLLSAADLGKLYEGVEDSAVERETTGRASSFRRDIRKLRRMAGEPKAVLEIGAFTGIAAGVFREDIPGADFLGIEPSRWAVGVAQGRRLNVIHGGVGDPLPKTGFDWIVSWDVIEHLEDPHQFFDWARAQASPGAFLLVSTPDWGSIWRRLFGKRWWFIEPMHRSYFSLGLLTRLAEAHGWKLEGSWAHEKRLSVPYAISRFVEIFGIAFEPRPAPRTRMIIPLRAGQMTAIYRLPPPGTPR